MGAGRGSAAKGLAVALLVALGAPGCALFDALAGGAGADPGLDPDGAAPDGSLPPPPDGGPAPRCGDGVSDPGEACDDGNELDADGCEADCTLPACGNAIRDPGELCFGLLLRVPLGGGAEGLAAGAIDELPGADLVAVSVEAPDTITVIFSPAVPAQRTTIELPGLADPLAVATGDLDDDGLDDVVVANGAASSTETLTVVRSLGAGMLAPAETVGASAQPVGVAIGDLDGDGDLDVATSEVEASGRSVSVIRNDGAGALLDAGSQGLGSDVPAGVAVADFTGDGLDDLAIALPVEGEVRVHPGQAAPGILDSSATFRSAHPGTVALAAGDLDGDGEPDLVAANRTANDVSLLFNLGGGAFAAPTQVAVGAGPIAIALGDLDGDGSLDVVTADSAANTVTIVLRGKTDSPRLVQGLAVGRSPSAVVVADLDGDGDLDLAVASRQDAELRILLAEP